MASSISCLSSCFPSSLFAPAVKRGDMDFQLVAGRTPMQTLIDGKPIWKEKFVG